MTKQATVISLQDRAELLRQNRGDNIALDDIASVVGSLVEGTTPDNDTYKIANELKELLDFVGAARDELMTMQPKNLSNREIPDANVQLDAIVSATEGAASTIMDAADTLGDMSDKIGGDDGAKLFEVSTQLFEASSFQDLTGQRITKITKTLFHLEERLNALADAIGDDYIAPEEDITKDDEGVAVDHEDLLNGPQLEGEGNSQAEIDALLASFD